jgi:hypothetical protein
MNLEESIFFSETSVTCQKIVGLLFIRYSRERLKFNVKINLFNRRTCARNRSSKGLLWNSVPFAGCVPACLCFSLPWFSPHLSSYSVQLSLWEGSFAVWSRCSHERCWNAMISVLTCCLVYNRTSAPCSVRRTYKSISCITTTLLIKPLLNKGLL